MTYARQMIEANPSGAAVDAAALVERIEACTACARPCRLCGDECYQHTQHSMEHCQIFVEARRRCESACNDLCNRLEDS